MLHNWPPRALLSTGPFRGVACQTSDLLFQDHGFVIMSKMCLVRVGPGCINGGQRGSLKTHSVELRVFFSLFCFSIDISLRFRVLVWNLSASQSISLVQAHCHDGRFERRVSKSHRQPLYSMSRFRATRDEKLPRLGFRGRMAGAERIKAVSRFWVRILQYDCQQLPLRPLPLARTRSCQDPRSTGTSFHK